MSDTSLMSKLNVGIIAMLIVFVVADANAQLSTPKVVTGEYIVKFKPQKTPGGNLRAVNKMGRNVSIRSVFPGSQMMHLKVDSMAARDALYASSDVEFIEPNYILSVDPVDVSGLGSAPQSTDTYSQSNANVQVKDSWAIGKPYDQGAKTVVAIIDTGLDKTHLIFKDSGGIWENLAEKNGVAGVDDDSNGFIDDVNGWNFVSNNENSVDDNDHGTHVAGIVLGVGQDIFENPVRESKVAIMALKFLDSTGAGSTSSAVNAIYYAVNNGAKVINNSWGGASYSQSLHEAYTYAYTKGVVIVSAAGNSNTDNDTTAMYPSNLDSPNNISVGAATDYDNKASFSNYGNTSVSVAAPGVAILSSVPGSGCLAPGCFQMMSGTSMAAPFVAGLAALVIREAPQLSAYQIRSIVVASVDVFSTLAGKVNGGGRVNAHKAITNAKAQNSVAAWAPAYTPDYKTNRSIASGADSGDAAPAGCGLVKALIDNGGDSGSASGGAVSDFASVLALILLPIVIAVNLRARATRIVPVANRRFFDRYMISKKAVLEVCGQIINVTTDDVSLGGISFKGVADAALMKGQIISVKFNEESAEQIEAEVVWCSKKQEYGLKFINLSEEIKFEIKSWTRGLVPTN